MRFSELRTDDRHIPPRPSPLDIRMATPLSNIANNMNRGFPTHLAELEALRRSTQSSDVAMTSMAVASRDALYRHPTGTLLRVKKESFEFAIGFSLSVGDPTFN